MLVCMVASLKQQMAGCMANKKDRFQTEALNLRKTLQLLPPQVHFEVAELYGT